MGISLRSTFYTLLPLSVAPLRPWEPLMVPVEKVGHCSSPITTSSSNIEHNHTNMSICVKSGSPWAEAL